MEFRIKTHKAKSVKVENGRRIETEIEVPSYTFMIVDREKATQTPLPNVKKIDGGPGGYDIEGQEYKLEPVDEEARKYMADFHEKRAKSKAKGQPAKAEAAGAKK